MCGIVGYTNDYTTPDDLDILRKVLIESRIRGKHASGLAWFTGKAIQSVTKPIPIDDLIKDFDLSKMVYNNRLSMIAHARYSTSDIAYNQPIASKTFAIAHNGVVTQSSPDSWKKQYGYTCLGKNDSELLLRAMEAHDDPFKKFPQASIAAVIMDNTGNVTCMRNSLRPLWKGHIGKGTVFASTYHILFKAGVSDISKIECLNDQQRRDWRTWKK